MEKIEEIWKTKGANLIIPSVFIAIDRAKCKYFIIQDSSTIIYMVKNGSNTTYAIPKKYCVYDKKVKVYRIEEIEKLIPVSCQRKNDYELFVQKYLIK